MYLLIVKQGYGRENKTKGSVVVYLDTLDTVRFGTDLSKESLIVSNNLAKASVMSNLILGEKIVLSQSQLLDSGFILNALGDSGFRRLVERHYIDTTLYRLHDGITFRKHLAMYLEDSNFLFSAVDKNQQIQKDYKEHVIAVLEGKTLHYDSSMIPIKNMVEFFTSLERNRGYRPFAASNVSDYKTSNGTTISLSELLKAHLKNMNPPKCDSLTQSLSLLLAKAGSAEINNRSYYYEESDVLCKYDATKIKALVDLYYNCILSVSVMNNTGINGKMSVELTDGKTVLEESDWKAVHKVCSCYNMDCQDITYYFDKMPDQTKWSDICSYLEHLNDCKNNNFYLAQLRKILISAAPVALVVSAGGIALELEAVGNTSGIGKFFEKSVCTLLIPAISQLATLSADHYSDKKISEIFHEHSMRKNINKLKNVKGVVTK